MKRSPITIFFMFLFLVTLACGGSQANEPTSAPPAATNTTAAAAAEPTAPSAPTEVPQVAPTSPPATTEAPAPTAEPTPPPVAGPAYMSIDVEPGLYLYTSGNFIRDMTLYEGKVWIASLGGVVAWDADSGTSTKYTTMDGLPHVGVYGITACPIPEMTLLAATEDGLAAYDPDLDMWYRSDLFQRDVVQGLFGTVGAEIGQIVCDTANNRLIMEYRGVTIINLADGAIQNIPGSNLSWSGVRRLTLIGNQVWVSSGFRGFTILEGDNALPYSKHAETFASDSIYHIAAAPNGDIWMATGDGLIRYQNGQVMAQYNRDNTTDFATPYHVAFAPDGKMWVGMTGRLCQFDPAAGQCAENFRSSQDDNMATGEVSKILFDEAGNIYYHTFEGGWSRYNGSSWQLYRDNDLPIHAVGTVYDDGQGNIWLLGGTAYTLSGDLERKSDWVRYRDMGGDDVVADADGGIWMASGRNLYHYDGFRIVRRQVADGLLDSYARTVAIDHEGRIWVGQEDGVSIWDGQAFTTYSTAADGWPAGRIYTLLADGEVMWAGTDKGLIRVDAGGWEVVLASGVVGLPSQIINALAVLTDGRLAVGTTGGLVYYDHANKRLEPVAEVAVTVSDIAVSIYGDLFVTSYADVGGGLYVYDDEGWTHFTTADGLPTNRLRTLVIDRAGTLWVGGGFWASGGGLMRIVP